MPIRKPSDSLKKVNPIVLIHGDPGCGKTTLASGLDSPVLFDFDKGYRRSEYSKDLFELLTIEDMDMPNEPDDMKAILESAKAWEEFVKSLNSLEGAKTLVFDTAKAMLDDYIAKFVITQDHRNYKPSTGGLELSGYGDMGAIFSNKIIPLKRKYPLVFFSHSRTNQDSIYKHMEPDLTGASASILTRACDAIGYLTYDGKVRKIKFSKSDTYVSKAYFIGDLIVPDLSDKDFETFLQTEVVDVIGKKLNKRFVEATVLDYGFGETPEEWIVAKNKYKAENNLRALNALMEITTAKGYVYNKTSDAFAIPEPKSKK